MRFYLLNFLVKVTWRFLDGKTRRNLRVEISDWIIELKSSKENKKLEYKLKTLLDWTQRNS